jgi:UPF0716 protein FxsA
LLTRLLLLFILVPAVELILLIEIGQLIGTVPTIGLIIFTGVLGAYLAQRQGVQVLKQIRAEMQAGRLPADSVFDGAMILVAGAVLMTPGVLTDIAGLLCLIPPTRRVIKGLIWSRLRRAFRNGRIFTAGYPGTDYRREPEDVVIIDSDDYK